MTQLGPPALLSDLPEPRTAAGPGRLGANVALVTGATGEIGRAVARRFAAEGASLLLTDVGGRGLSEIRREIGETSPRCSVLTTELDVTEPLAWTKALRAGRRSLGHIDLLIHCAGVPAAARLDQLGQEEWDRVVAVNQTSLLTGIQSCLPTMWRAGGGAVVAIGSVFGMVGSGGAFAYHATKGALQAMVTAAAVELAPRRVRINAVLPGVLRTGLTAHLSDAYFDHHRSATPLNRLAGADDVAAAVLFLASREADFVTGALLPVDGGFLCR